MDVNSVSNSIIQNQGLNAARSAYGNFANNAPQSAPAEETPAVGEAFEVEISAQARQLADETEPVELDVETLREGMARARLESAENGLTVTALPDAEEPETVEEVIEEKVEEATATSTASATTTANTSTATSQATNATAATGNAAKTKGLSAEQIRYLEQTMAMSQQSMLNLMVQALSDHNSKLQGLANSGVKTLNFGGNQVNASMLVLPEVATNPEDAAKAVGEGGDWSVGAVTDRIFNLAETIAGGDPEKLEQMRAAVEEGFKQAGGAWTNATGLNDMPDITSQTHDSIMKRFDDRMKELQSSGLA